MVNEFKGSYCVVLSWNAGTVVAGGECASQRQTTYSCNVSGLAAYGGVQKGS